MARLKHFMIEQGDDLSFTITFKNLTTSITGIELGAKRSLSQESYDVYLYENHGISKLASNKYLINLSPEITSDLEPAWYFYQLKCNIAGLPRTPLKGKLVIQEPVIHG